MLASDKAIEKAEQKIRQCVITNKHSISGSMWGNYCEPSDALGCESWSLKSLSYQKRLQHPNQKENDVKVVTFSKDRSVRPHINPKKQWYSSMKKSHMLNVIQIFYCISHLLTTLKQLSAHSEKDYKLTLKEIFCSWASRRNLLSFF